MFVKSTEFIFSTTAMTVKRFTHMRSYSRVSVQTVLYLIKCINLSISAIIYYSNVEHLDKMYNNECKKIHEKTKSLTERLNYYKQLKHQVLLLTNLQASIEAVSIRQNEEKLYEHITILYKDSCKSLVSQMESKMKLLENYSMLIFYL